MITKPDARPLIHQGKTSMLRCGPRAKNDNRGPRTVTHLWSERDKQAWRHLRAKYKARFEATIETSRSCVRHVKTLANASSL
eukprot:6183452-Pleurochrysis_carterae.AAC.2